jgi:hypothetical protein
MPVIIVFILVIFLGRTVTEAFTLLLLTVFGGILTIFIIRFSIAILPSYSKEYYNYTIKKEQQPADAKISNKSR